MRQSKIKENVKSLSLKRAWRRRRRKEGEFEGITRALTPTRTHTHSHAHALTRTHTHIHTDFNDVVDVCGEMQRLNLK